MVKGKVVAANLGLPANRAPAARLETYLPTQLKVLFILSLTSRFERLSVSHQMFTQLIARPSKC